MYVYIYIYIVIIMIIMIIVIIQYIQIYIYVLLERRSTVLNHSLSEFSPIPTPKYWMEDSILGSVAIVKRDFDDLIKQEKVNNYP